MYHFKKGRLVERNENIEATQRNKKAIEQNKELYKRRQQIVEHPFGTIKRQWGFDYTLMKGKKKVDGEMGLIFIAYLFTRLRSILGLEGLRAAIVCLLSRYFSFKPAQKQLIDHFRSLPAIFSQNCPSKHLFQECFVTLPYY